MKRRFKEARLLKGMKLSECSDKLGVGQPTLSAWERETKNPMLENLEAMADLYQVSVDYLLGRTPQNVNHSKPITKELLPLLHGNPVWNDKLGWCIVDNINGRLCTINGNIPISDTPLYLNPDTLSLSANKTKPIIRDLLCSFDEVIVEPISIDRNLKQQLRGYYIVKDGYVENSIGNRFFFDTYGFQWLAFEK